MNLIADKMYIYEHCLPWNIYATMFFWLRCRWPRYLFGKNSSRASKCLKKKFPDKDNGWCCIYDRSNDISFPPVDVWQWERLLWKVVCWIKVKRTIISSELRPECITTLEKTVLEFFDSQCISAIVDCPQQLPVSTINSTPSVLYFKVAKKTASLEGHTQKELRRGWWGCNDRL